VGLGRGVGIGVCFAPEPGENVEHRIEYSLLCLQVLDEFYENLKAVGVSAATGAGMEELFTAVDECREEYNQTYKKELEQRAKVYPPPPPVCL